MQKKHILLELPERGDDFQRIISDEKHDVRQVSLSSIWDGKIRHFVLIVWHDEEYGDHMF